MKKAFSIVLTILLLFTACSKGGIDTFAPSKMPESSKSIASSIFGRNISYNAYTPADKLILPASEILNMVQVEKTLYLLTEGAVYTLNTETGEDEKLFDTVSPVLAIHGGRLYTYSEENSKVVERDLSGNVLGETSIDLSEVEAVAGLSVTDDYFVFTCQIPGNMYMETYAFTFSRESGEQVQKKKMPLTGISLYSYKGNELLSVTLDGTYNLVYLGIFDPKTAKNQHVQELGNEQSVGYSPAVCYREKTDTAFVFGGGIGKDSPCCITEYSLADSDYIVHNRYYLNVSGDGRFFIGACENIICALSTDSGLYVHDMLTPPESITILGINTVEDVVYSFEKETGILVKTAYTDYEKLVLKLMAGDSDFDIFNTGSGFHNYVNAGTFVDLKEIESLNSRISGNTAADFAVSYKGKYFGVPTGISESMTNEDYFPENGSAVSYSLVASENIYYAKFVDAAEKSYTDPEGKELYKLLKFIYDNPTGNRNAMPFGDSIKVYSANVYLLNPQSQNRDNAVKFLEYLFDACEKGGGYPELSSTENCRLEWRCRPMEIIAPILDARIALQKPNAKYSTSDLKRLAREAAAEVAMRMEE